MHKLYEEKNYYIKYLILIYNFKFTFKFCVMIYIKDMNLVYSNKLF